MIPKSVPKGNLKNFPSPETAEAIIVEPSDDPGCWLVRTPRGHAWLHIKLDEAVRDAREIAAGFGLPVVVLPDEVVS